MYKAENHLNIVQSVLNKYYGGGHNIASRIGIEPEDLFQIGCMGLMKACEHYDPDNEKKASFLTYAYIKIRAEINHSIRDDSYLAKYSKKVRELAPLAMKLGDPSPEEIQERLNVSYEDALDTYFYINRTGVSFFRKTSEGDEMTLFDLIPAESETTEDKALRSIEFEERINILNDNQKKVCYMLLEGKTQLEIADTMNIKQAQVSRLRIKSLAKIKEEYLA